MQQGVEAVIHSQEQRTPAVHMLLSVHMPHFSEVLDPSPVNGDTACGSYPLNLEDWGHSLCSCLQIFLH